MNYLYWFQIYLSYIRQSRFLVENCLSEVMMFTRNSHFLIRTTNKHIPNRARKQTNRFIPINSDSNIDFNTLFQHYARSLLHERKTKTPPSRVAKHTHTLVHPPFIFKTTRFAWGTTNFPPFYLRCPPPRPLCLLFTLLVQHNFPPATESLCCLLIEAISRRCVALWWVEMRLAFSRGLVLKRRGGIWENMMCFSCKGGNVNLSSKCLWTFHQHYLMLQFSTWMNSTWLLFVPVVHPFRKGGCLSLLGRGCRSVEL